MRRTDDTKHFIQDRFSEVELKLRKKESLKIVVYLIQHFWRVFLYKRLPEHRATKSYIYLRILSCQRDCELARLLWIPVESVSKFLFLFVFSCEADTHTRVRVLYISS